MNGPTLADDFIPSRPLRPAMLQTILASRKIRMRGQGPLLGAAREVILESGDGVRLQGFHSPHPEGGGAGTVVLIHGWEGSAESAYVMCASRHLFDRGFGVFRLNLRDHGDTHHMNEGLFYATLIPETLRAVQGVAELTNGAPLYLVGFSMGGSFVLRVGLACAGSPIPGLRHIVAVSPVIHPEKSTVAIDARSPDQVVLSKKMAAISEEKAGTLPRPVRLHPGIGPADPPGHVRGFNRPVQRLFLPGGLLLGLHPDRFGPARFRDAAHHYHGPGRPGHSGGGLLRP